MAGWAPGGGPSGHCVYEQICLLYPPPPRDVVVSRHTHLTGSWARQSWHCDNRGMLVPPRRPPCEATRLQRCPGALRGVGRLTAEFWPHYVCPSRAGSHRRAAGSP